MASEQEPELSLVPGSGVEIVDGRMVANSLPVWLALHPIGAIRPGHWLRLRYSTSFYDENVRPLIRITSADGVLIEPMNGTLHGVGEWIGRIPDRVSAIEISPVSRIGPFEFRIDKFQHLSAARLALQGLFAKPRWITWAIETHLRGARGEAHRALRFASGSGRLDVYHRWHRRMSRALDLNGLDRPRPHWAQGPAVRVFMAIDRDGVRRFASTLQSLRSQVYRRWLLHVTFDDACSDTDRQALRLLLADDSRLHEVRSDTPLTALLSDHTHLSPDDICCVVTPGNILPDYALAAVAEAKHSNPDVALLYGDEDSIASSGRLHSPRLLPDWSPHLHDSSSYFGETVWISARELAATGITVGQWVAAKDDIVARIARGRARAAVCHIRRILCRRFTEEDQIAGERETPARQSIKPSYSGQCPAVAVIVLTRDNPDCLSQCVAGLTQTTDYPDFHITIVDNGSVSADSLALLQDFRRHPRIAVLDKPGPFNFSALCNDAARATRAPVLLFLNDDIAVKEPGWMPPLVNWALRPNVGAVGAKLLFPEGTIQHAGVTLGLGGIAGHLYRRGSARQRGYLNGLAVAREVGAVTGACLAIERRKFEEVGGFDAENLPVELNDVDLCLRLAERGYATVWTPESVLVHHESATRGDSAWSSKQYQNERLYFITKWQEAIRNDPCFHPSLSLFSYEPELAYSAGASFRPLSR